MSNPVTQIQGNWDNFWQNMNVNDLSKGLTSYNTEEILASVDASSGAGMPSLLDMYNKDLGPLQKALADIYIQFTGGLDFVEESLQITQFDFQIMGSIWDLLLPMATGLMVLYFILNILNTSMNHFKDIDYKYIVLCIIKLILAISILNYGPNILGWCINLGNTVLRYFVDNPVAPGSTDDGMRIKYIRLVITQLKEMEFLLALCYYIGASILQFLNLIPNAFIFFHTCARKLEIILRGGLMGCAIQDIFEGGMQSTAVRYIKRLCVVILHGFVMLIVVQIAGTLGTQDFFTTVVDAGAVPFGSISAFVDSLMFNFAAIGVIASSKAILNDMLGA